MAHFTSSPAWRAIRAAVLRDNPRCTTPGCTRPSSHVDHITARADGGSLFDLANLQALCHPCHSRKTAAADGGFGNRKGGRVGPLKGCDAAGNPLDGTHRWHQ